MKNNHIERIFVCYVRTVFSVCFPAGTRRLCNVRLTLDMTSDRCCIVVENENRVDVNIWRQFDVGFWLHNLKTTKSQRQLTSVLDIQFNIDIRRWIYIEFWSPDVATKI